MPENSVLLVDDEASICWAIERALSEEGYRITTVASAEEAMECVRLSTPDVVLMDIRLPGMDGLTALQQFCDQIRGTPVIIMTAFGSLDTAVRAISQGAFEYLTKPFDLDDAIAVVRRALDARSVAVAHSEPLEQLIRGQLLGTSAAMQAVFRRIALVAQQDVSVLITGESGTGKELVANAIHRYGRRSSGPFVSVCVPAMSESLIESELFGHSKGAFTGADFRRVGLLEMADGGTAFLDELGDITPAIQVKLLRVLESKMVTPVGTNEARRVDFRLVAATNRNLDLMVEQETFRRDLFYRLNVFRIELPPLRDRMEDVPLQAQHFADSIVRTGGRVVVSEAAIRELQSRPWHGNVRELRNAIEHAAVMARSGEILPEYLPAAATVPVPETLAEERLVAAIDEWWNRRIVDSPSPESLRGLYEQFLNSVEPVLLQRALSFSGGNRQEAARLLGLHRQTLREKLKRFGLDAAAGKGDG